MSSGCNAHFTGSRQHRTATHSRYFAGLLRKLHSGCSMDRCFCWPSPVIPTWCSRPRLVCDTNSAAPPIGFVTTPMRPLLMPDTSPVAVPDTPPRHSAVGARVNTCSGWSAMPAKAPTAVNVSRNKTTLTMANAWKTSLQKYASNQSIKQWFFRVA